MNCQRGPFFQEMGAAGQDLLQPGKRLEDFFVTNDDERRGVEKLDRSTPPFPGELFFHLIR